MLGKKGKGKDHQDKSAKEFHVSGFDFSTDAARRQRAAVKIENLTCLFQLPSGSAAFVHIFSEKLACLTNQNVKKKTA
jgi:hypothetical protein